MGLTGINGTWWDPRCGIWQMQGLYYLASVARGIKVGGEGHGMAWHGVLFLAYCMDSSSKLCGHLVSVASFCFPSLPVSFFFPFLFLGKGGGGGGGGGEVSQIGNERTYSSLQLVLVFIPSSFRLAMLFRCLACPC